MNFFCVLTKYRKKFDKFVKINNIKNKYIIDLRELMQQNELTFSDDKTYLKILIFEKIEKAMERGKDIYYIPYVDGDFNLEKLLNLKKILGDNNFNIIIFWNDFEGRRYILDDVLNNLPKFTNSQILKDY